MSTPKNDDLYVRQLRNGKIIPLQTPQVEDNQLNETIIDMGNTQLDDDLAPPGPQPQVPSPQGPSPQIPTPRGPSPRGPSPQAPSPQRYMNEDPYFSSQDVRRGINPPIRGRGRGRGRGTYHGQKPPRPMQQWENAQSQQYQFPQQFPQQQQYTYLQQQQQPIYPQNTYVHPSQYTQNGLTPPPQIGQFPDWRRVFPAATDTMPRNIMERPYIVNSLESELNPNVTNQSSEIYPQAQQQTSLNQLPVQQRCQNTTANIVTPEIVNTKLRLPNFSGKENDWGAFRSQFALMAGTLRWSDKEKLLQLMTALDNRSRAYITNYFTDIMTATWMEVVDKLENRFKVKDTDHYRSMLFAQKFKIGDNIVEHTDALRNLARKAFPTQDQNFLEDMLKTALYRSIVDKDLSKYLSAQRILLTNTEDIENAIQSYQRIESVENRTDFRKPSFFKPYNKINMVQLEESEEENVENTELEQCLYYIQNKLQKKRDYTKIICHHCGGRGHFQNECPSKSRCDSLNGKTSFQKTEEGSLEKKSMKDQ